MEERRSAVVVSTILPDPPRSGGQRRSLRLLEAMERAGVRPHLLVAGEGSEGDAEPLRDRGWAVECHPPAEVTPASRLASHVQGAAGPVVPRVGKRIRELEAAGAAFVQFEQTHSARHLALPTIPSIFSTHNVDSELIASEARAERRLLARLRTHAEAKQMRRAERRAAREASHVLCVSEHDSAAFARMGAQAPLLVPNGVDDELFEIPDRDGAGDSILFFGLLSWAPNANGLMRFLRESWADVAEHAPGARLRIVGAGAGSELTEAAAQAPGVKLVGPVSSIADELARAQVVVVPIWTGGGTRLKVIESMAAGRLVVGTPLGVEGVGFEHGVHGLVAEDPRGLAKATVRALTDPAFRLAAGKRARDLAARYRWRDVTRPAEELYRRLARTP